MKDPTPHPQTNWITAWNFFEETAGSRYHTRFVNGTFGCNAVLNNMSQVDDLIKVLSDEFVLQEAYIAPTAGVQQDNDYTACAIPGSSDRVPKGWRLEMNNGWTRANFPEQVKRHLPLKIIFQAPHEMQPRIVQKQVGGLMADCVKLQLPTLQLRDKMHFLDVFFEANSTPNLIKESLMTAVDDPGEDNVIAQVLANGGGPGVYNTGFKAEKWTFLSRTSNWKVKVSSMQASCKVAATSEALRIFQFSTNNQGLITQYAEHQEIPVYSLETLQASVTSAFVFAAHVISFLFPVAAMNHVSQRPYKRQRIIIGEKDDAPAPEPVELV